MITKLTKKQEAQIPKFIDKYINLASKPTDRKKATKAVENLYANGGFEKPIVIYGKSPFQTAIMVAMCKIIFKEKNVDLLKDDSQLDSQLRSQLRSQLDSQLDSQLRSQLRSQLDSQLRSQLRSQLDSQLDSQLYSQLDSQLDSQLKNINSDWWLVVWWLVWAGWYSFGEYIGVKFDSKILKIFMDFVTNVSFIIPYKGIAFVSETPIEISWENQRLSSKTQPAIKYDSGGTDDLYFLNGVRFDKEWHTKIVNDEMSPEEIFAIDNLEHRRIAYEYMDKIKMKSLKDYKVLDEQTDSKGNPMKIISFIVKGVDDPLKYYNCICPSTGREYFLGTDTDTCIEAKNKSFGLSEIEFVDEW
jgi:flagellar basal body-associated protein FliL